MTQAERMRCPWPKAAPSGGPSLPSLPLQVDVTYNCDAAALIDKGVPAGQCDRQLRRDICAAI